MLRDGRVQCNGAVLFDPAEKGAGRERLRALLAGFAATAQKRGEVRPGDEADEPGWLTSSPLLVADEQVDWKHVHALLRDLTETKPLRFGPIDFAIRPRDAKAGAARSGGTAKDR